MLIGSYFKQRRLGKGLSEVEVAELISKDFQASLLWDFEAGDDTDIDGWSIQEFKKYCEVLEIPPEKYAEIPASNLSNLPLSALIKTRRKEMGYSIQKLSDEIGYEKVVIEAIENDNRSTVICLNVLKQLALVLGIPFQILLEKI